MIKINYEKISLFALICLGLEANSQSQTVCAGSTVALQATPPVPNSTLTFPSGAANTSTDGVFVFAPTVTATYTLRTGPTTTFAFVVTVNSQPVISQFSTVVQPTCGVPTSCFNFSLTFIPSSGPQPTYGVTWGIPPNGTVAFVPGCAASSPTITSCCGTITPGIYTATVTAAGGCIARTIFTIQNEPAPAVYSLQPSSPIQSITCFEPNPCVAANNPANTYTWSSNSISSNSNSICVNSSNVGTITVIGTNTVSGCTLSRTIAVVLNTTVPSGTVSPTTQLINCTTPAQQVTLTCSSPITGFDFKIQPPTSPSPWVSSNLTPAFFQPGVGVHGGTLTNNSNGCTLAINFTVNTSQAFPTYTLSSDKNFTLGCNSRSVASICFTTSQGVPPGSPLSFAFLPPGGSTVLPATGSLGAISCTNITIPGQWTVVCRQNSNLCDNRTPVTILQNTVGPLLDSVQMPRKVLTCANPTVMLKAWSEANSNISYLWQYGSGPVSLATSTINVTATLSAFTTTVLNNFSLTLTDLNSTCTTPTVINVYQNVYPPKASFAPAGSGTNAITCANANIQLANTSSPGTPTNNPLFPPQQPAVGFLWSGPSPQIDLSNSSSYNAGIVGTYTMVALDLNNGCTASATLAIIDNIIKPVVNAPTTNFILDCGPITAQTRSLALVYDKNQYGAAGFTFTWTPPVVLPGTSYTLATFVPKSKGVHTVVVNNPLNGCATTVTTTVELGSLKGSVDVSETEIFAGNTINFTNNSFSADTIKSGISSYWNFGNGTSSVVASPGTGSTTALITKFTSARFALPGTYTVKVIVSKSPCRDSVTKVINVEIPSSIKVPNVFTPNGDGINDFYFLKTNNLTKISFSIFDRWGRLVFDVKESTTGNISWDGKNPDGKEAADGTYFYFYTATGKDGVEYNDKGSISLIR